MHFKIRYEFRNGRLYILMCKITENVGIFKNFGCQILGKLQEKSG